MSSPDCSDRCRCGISRGSVAIASSRSSSASIESIEDSRRRLTSGTCLQDRLHQPAELRRARQVGAIAGHVDAGQHDLGIAVAGQPLDLLDHRAHRHRARIAAAIGDDAEGAAMVAAVLHLDEGARPALDRVDHMGGGLAHGHDVVDARLLGIVDAEIRQRAIVAGAASFSSLPSTRSTSSMAAKLCGSVCAAQPVTMMRAFGLLAARLADRLPGLAHGFGGDRAGVEDHRAIVEPAKPGGFGLAAHHLGFIGVEPAAEGDDVDRHQAAPCCSRAHDAGRRIEAAGKFPFGRAGHDDMVVVAPFDREVAAGHGDRHCAAGAPGAGGADGGGAGGRAAGLGQPGAALPGADRDRFAATVTWAIVMLARSGKIGWFSSSGPKRSSS